MKNTKTPTVVLVAVFTAALALSAGEESGRERPLVGAIRWDAGWSVRIREN